MINEADKDNDNEFGEDVLLKLCRRLICFKILLRNLLFFVI